MAASSCELAEKADSPVRSPEKRRGEENPPGSRDGTPFPSGESLRSQARHCPEQPQYQERPHQMMADRGGKVSADESQNRPRQSACETAVSSQLVKCAGGEAFRAKESKGSQSACQEPCRERPPGALAGRENRCAVLHRVEMALHDAGPPEAGSGGAGRGKI